MNSIHLRLWADAQVVLEAEREREAAWARWEMEQDEAYQKAHPVEPDDGFFFFDEHGDSGWQCGKDLGDDRI